MAILGAIGLMSVVALPVPAEAASVVRLGPGEPGAVEVAADARGNVTVVWHRNSSDPILRVARRDAAGTWDRPMSLARGFGPALAVAPGGSVNVLWAEGDCCSTSTIKVASRSRQGVWSDPVSLGSGAYSSRLIVDARGNVAAAWPVGAGASTTVMAAGRPAGGTWQRPTAVGLGTVRTLASSGPKGTAVVSWSPNVFQRARARSGSANLTVAGNWRSYRFPRSGEPTPSSPVPGSVADARGNAVSAWADRRVVRASVRPAGRAWSRPVVLGRGAIADSVVGLDGQAAVAWQGPDSGLGGRQWVAQRGRDGRWQAPLDLGRGAATALAIDRAGRVTAVWTTRDDDRGQIAMAVTGLAGGGWEPPREIGQLYGEQIGVSKGGDLIVVGASDRGAIRAVIRPAGSDWQPPVSFGPGQNPRIVFAGDREAVVVWQSQRGVFASGIGTGP